MKNFLRQILIPGLCLLSFCMVSVAAAADEGKDAPASRTTRASRAKVGSVTALCKKIKWVKRKPSLKAKYYMVIAPYELGGVQSPTCGSDYFIMSTSGKELMTLDETYYKAVKKDGRMELFIVSKRSEKDAKAYLRESDVTIPLTLNSDKAYKQLPGVSKFRTSRVTCLLLRASDGAALKYGYYEEMVPQWETLLLEAESAEAGEGAQ